MKRLSQGDFGNTVDDAGGQPLRSQMDVKSLPPRLREALFERQFFVTPDVRRVMGQLMRSIVRQSERKEGAGLLITGEVESGKTGIIAHLLHSWLRAADERVDHPLIVSFRDVRWGDDVAWEIADAAAEFPVLLRYPEATIDAKKLVELLLRSDAGFLILDDVDQLNELPVGEQKRAGHIIEVLNRTIPMVLVGNEDAQLFLRSQPQLFDRFTESVMLNPLPQGDPGGFEEFLRALDDGLPLADSSNLAEGPLAELLYLQTQGYTGRICRSVKSALHQALRAGRERLLPEDLWTEAMGA